MTTDWESGIETNRESTETEVVAPTNEVTSVVLSSTQNQEGSGDKEQELLQESSQEAVDQCSTSKSKTVPENGEIIELGKEESVSVICEDTGGNSQNRGMANGHTSTSISDGNSNGGDNNNTSLDDATSTKCSNPVGTPVQEGTQHS